jgi:hypothetical protein
MFYLIQTEENKFLIIEYSTRVRKPVIGSYVGPLKLSGNTTGGIVDSIIDSSFSVIYLKDKYPECFI